MRVLVRNLNTSRLYYGNAADDFVSDVADFKEMSIGFVQAIYGAPTEHKGTFRLLVSGRIELDTFALLPGSEQIMDASCPAVGWNLCCIGWRFLVVEYVANGQEDMPIEVIAIGKKGG